LQLFHQRGLVPPAAIFRLIQMFPAVQCRKQEVLLWPNGSMCWWWLDISPILQCPRFEHEWAHPKWERCAWRIQLQ